MAKVALLIGVSQYEPGLNPLPAAEHDVAAMQEVLLNPDIGGFSEPDLTVLLNPDRQTMEESIELLFSSRQKDDLVLFYFSGHGIKDYSGKLFLASRKTRKSARGDLILSTAVSSAFIQDNMNRSRSRRQVIILDSCFSGAFAEGLSAKDDCSVDVAAQLGGEGRAILTSSSSTQYSFEQEGEKLSFYTRFLVDGIGTGAADQDDDGLVSIDELHDYASQKVREIRPEIKPEIYAIREGFKIHLTKVPPLSPTHRYRREVALFITRGELSLIGRRTLDVLRAQLRMDIAEAKAIEDEVLEPFRVEFQEKLRQYQQVFKETLEHQGSITETDREQLQQLQQILGLRNEDTRPIEQEIITELKVYKQKLEEYEQLYSEALRQEFPLSEARSAELSQLKQQYKLKKADWRLLESQIYAEAEKYHKNIATFEKALSQAVRKQYPLTEDKRTELKNLQNSLELTDVDIAPVEAKVTNEIQTYQQKLQQYEQAFVNATQGKYYPGQATKKQLQETWQALGLEEGDVQRIEGHILKQVELHQENLSRYVQELTLTITRHYPLEQEQRQWLKQKQIELLLSDEDTTQVENQVVAEEEERRAKLSQYEEAYREAIAYESPLSNTTLEELQRFQNILGLQNEAVAAIEKQVEKEAQGDLAFPRLIEPVQETESVAVIAQEEKEVETEAQQVNSYKLKWVALIVGLFFACLATIFLLNWPVVTEVSMNETATSYGDSLVVYEPSRPPTDVQIMNNDSPKFENNEPDTTTPKKLKEETKIGDENVHQGTVKEEAKDSKFQEIEGTIYVDGNKYVGTHLQGKPHGKGTMYYNRGIKKVFTGDFKNGKPNGIGKMEFRDKSTFVGKFVDGKPQGIGKMTVPNMSNHKQVEYTVVYSDNKPLQIMKIIYSDQSAYSGEIDKDENIYLKHGNGVLKLANKDSIKGRWKDEQYIEDSVYTIFYHNGDVYNGTLIEDNGRYLKHGPGVMRYIDGKVDSGKWNMDKLIKKAKEEQIDSSQEQLPNDSSKRWK